VLMFVLVLARSVPCGLYNRFFCTICTIVDVCKLVGISWKKTELAEYY